jgi:hypothetical protein
MCTQAANFLRILHNFHVIYNLLFVCHNVCFLLDPYMVCEFRIILLYCITRAVLSNYALLINCQHGFNYFVMVHYSS